MWGKGEAPKVRKTKLEGNKEAYKGAQQSSNFVYYIITQDRLCHILSANIESTKRVGFYSDGSELVVYNSANTHIYNNKYE